MKSVSETKKILLLWSHLADYTVACFKKLAQKNDIELYIIYQPGERDAPYNQFDLGFCFKAFIFKREDKKELDEFCIKLKPDFIFMSSWNYKFYMSIAKKCKRRGSYVISSFDGQWRGTFKQMLGILVSPVFLKPAINNFFVPGDRQANFARKLGYKNPLQGYYCANTDRLKNIISKNGNKFIYVGRLISIKGIETLLKAYKEYRTSIKDPWDLVVCGTGELSYIFNNLEGVELKGFTQPDQLPELLSEAKCLLLPSHFEPWGLVIHEAAVAGLAIICSHQCGASTMFVRDGQNGYIINSDQKTLLHAMQKISDATKEQFEYLSATSKTLGSLWTTEKWANYVYRNISSISNSKTTFFIN